MLALVYVVGVVTIGAVMLKTNLYHPGAPRTLFVGSKGTSPAVVRQSFMIGDVQTWFVVLVPHVVAIVGVAALSAKGFGAVELHWFVPVFDTSISILCVVPTTILGGSP